MAQGPGRLDINFQEFPVRLLQFGVSQVLPPLFPSRQAGGKAEPGTFQIPPLPILILEINQRIQHSNQGFPVAFPQIMALHILHQQVHISLKIQALVQMRRTPVKVGQEGLIDLQFLIISLFQNVFSAVFFDFHTA